MIASAALPSAAAHDAFQAIYEHVKRFVFGPFALSLPVRDCCCGSRTSAAQTACLAAFLGFPITLGPLGGGETSVRGCDARQINPAQMPALTGTQLMARRC